MKRIVVSLGSAKSKKPVRKIGEVLAKLEAEGAVVKWWKMVAWNQIRITLA